MKLFWRMRARVCFKGGRTSRSCSWTVAVLTWPGPLLRALWFILPTEVVCCWIQWLYTRKEKTLSWLEVMFPCCHMLQLLSLTLLMPKGKSNYNPWLNWHQVHPWYHQYLGRRGLQLLAAATHVNLSKQSSWVAKRMKRGCKIKLAIWALMCTKRTRTWNLWLKKDGIGWSYPIGLRPNSSHCQLLHNRLWTSPITFTHFKVKWNLHYPSWSVPVLCLQGPLTGTRLQWIVALVGLWPTMLVFLANWFKSIQAGCFVLQNVFAWTSWI